MQIAYELKTLIEESNNLDFWVWETEPLISDCIHLLKRSSLAISMRFHGCIFSLHSGLTTIGIDYSSVEKGKVYNLFKSQGISERVINVKNIGKTSIQDIFINI